MSTIVGTDGDTFGPEGGIVGPTGPSGAAGATGPTGPSGFSNSGTRATQGSDADTLTLSGLTGDTDGDYEIVGTLITKGVPGATITLLLTGSEATAAMSTLIGEAVGVPSTGLAGELSAAATLQIGFDSTGPCVLTFYIRMSSKHGEIGTYFCSSQWSKDDNTVTIIHTISGRFNQAAQITSVGVHHGNGAGTGIAAGSFFRLRKLGLTA